MAQLSGGLGGGPPQNQEQQQQQQAEAAAAASERRSALLGAVLTPEARARLARVALVKPERARGVEDAVLAAAQRGALQGAVDESGVMDLLDRGVGGGGSGGGGSSRSGGGGNGPKITIARRKSVLDDDD